VAFPVDSHYGTLGEISTSAARAGFSGEKDFHCYKKAGTSACGVRDNRHHAIVGGELCYIVIHPIPAPPSSRSTPRQDRRPAESGQCRSTVISRAPEWTSAGEHPETGELLVEGVHSGAGPRPQAGLDETPRIPRFYDFAIVSVAGHSSGTEKLAGTENCPGRRRPGALSRKSIGGPAQREEHQIAVKQCRRHSTVARPLDDNATSELVHGSARTTILEALG